MRIEEFDYRLPTSLIAQYPSPQRGESRLMILRRGQDTIEHRSFQDMLDYFQSGDLLVVNNTRVLPARMIGKKETGGKVEILVLPSRNGIQGEWEVLIRGSGKIKQGTRIQFGPDFYGKVASVKDGRGKISFSTQGGLTDRLHEIGHIPLPPYIKREDEPIDRERYQTIFAEKEGAIAAPTAGLHFTQPLLQSLKEKGVKIISITLHIGVGTFVPVKVRDIEEHKMDTEWVEISEEASKEIERTRKQGGKIIAVGTTTTRALESFSDGNGGVRWGSETTSLFIYPPYCFNVIDGLVTNFHLPKSTLILLVSAFAGKEVLMTAYQKAIYQKYRFYSYGDAMLIL